MAITISARDLAVALRAVADMSELAEPMLTEMTRLLGSATAMVESYAELAPSAVQNEAVVRLAGWLWDSPPSRSFGNPMDSSGARAILAPYRTRRVFRLDAETPATPAESVN